MQATLPKREFKEVITGLARLIHGRTSLPILRGVRISSDSNGRVTAQATDLDSTATYSFHNASTEGEGSFIVDLDLLKPLAQGNGPDTLTFESTDGMEQVAVTTSLGGQALRRTLAALDPEDWPETCSIDMKTTSVEGFIDTYRKLAPFASTDETRYVLNAVNLDVSERKKDGSVMVSTDGRRLACRNHMTLPIGESCILRTSKFLTWTRLPADAEVGLAKNPSGATIGIKAGQWQFTTKAIDGTFPNWRQVVPRHTDAECHIELSEADCDLLLKALLSLPGKDAVTLVARNGKLSVWAHGADDTAWTALEIPEAKLDGNGLVYTTVDRAYLKQALSAGLMRDIRFRDELSPIVSEDGHGGTHVLMPLHGGAPAEITEAMEKHRQEAAREDVDEAPTEVDNTPADGPEAATPAAANGNREPSKGLPARKPANENKTKRGTKTMTDQDKNPEKHEGKSAIERAVEAFEQAKSAVRDANSLLGTLATELRNVARDQKAQATDLDKARGTLAKLQSMSL